ncbi:MAG: DNA helicase RecQ [Leptonema illini]|uniref:DNA helicase RecQ n=1 Tax=Leptonema illini TaxID=183 RepID=A0A833LWL4_9LEPT|nr:MAG: DNA helicase RecQ [Leptonema illini]
MALKRNGIEGQIAESQAVIMKRALSILKEVFGYDSFRPFQREVIDNVLSRRDTLAVLPTGAGKSLCYQIPALVFEKLSVVVSPLIALMNDQVEQLRAAGVPAVMLNSSLSPQEYQRNIDALQKGEARILYVAPETLLSPRVTDLLESLPLDLLTIDEAHCISDWGHDFRPEYRQIAAVRRRFPRAVCLALTATATERVRHDILTALGLDEAAQFVAGFDRSNLFIEVLPKQNALTQTFRFLEERRDQAGIIYCFSRRQVDDLAAALVQKGFSARPYHAGLGDAERAANQEAFLRDDIQIIVATIAFGMGINKPNVRFVIHYDLPKSIEGYYQEIGRAGRDGLPSHCLLLYSYGDVAKLRHFIDQKEEDERLAALEHLDALVRFAEQHAGCRRIPLLRYFGEEPTSTRCDRCDNCTSPTATLVDMTENAQKFLSCVKRTGERFGAGHVIDVLRGSKNEKVLRNRHQDLSTYGIGTNLTAIQWNHVARQLVRHGYLVQEGEFRTLRLSDLAIRSLRERAFIALEAMPQGEAPIRRSASTLATGMDETLFGLLRQRRKELADAAGIPPYIVFSDRTLVEMASALPQSDEELLSISGVGQVKLERYGEEFLGVIRQYVKGR